VKKKGPAAFDSDNDDDDDADEKQRKSDEKKIARTLLQAREFKVRFFI
jgi:hypothetical protein